jgi:hypothetical protein
MGYLTGPHDIKYGPDVIQEVEEVDVEYTNNTTDYETVQGRQTTVDTTKQVIATFTLLSNDTEALAVLLPQYFVPNGGTLSTGETVNSADGAIDVIPQGCISYDDITDVVITSCGNPNQVLRIPQCSTRIDGIEFDGAGARKVMVQFRGESDTVVQFFNQGAVTIAS